MYTVSQPVLVGVAHLWMRILVWLIGVLENLIACTLPFKSFSYPNPTH